MLPAPARVEPARRHGSFEAAREEFERRFVRAALAQAGGQRQVRGRGARRHAAGPGEDAAAARDRADTGLVASGHPALDTGLVASGFSRKILSGLHFRLKNGSHGELGWHDTRGFRL